MTGILSLTRWVIRSFFKLVSLPRSCQKLSDSLLAYNGLVTDTEDSAMMLGKAACKAGSCSASVSMDSCNRGGTLHAAKTDRCRLSSSADSSCTSNQRMKWFRNLVKVAKGIVPRSRACAPLQASRPLLVQHCLYTAGTIVQKSCCRVSEEYLHLAESQPPAETFNITGSYINNASR